MSLLLSWRRGLMTSASTLLKNRGFSLMLSQLPNQYTKTTMKKLVYIRQCSMFTPSTRPRRKKAEPEQIIAEPDWDFLDEARKCIKSVGIALEPMMELNKEFVLNKNDDELVLDVGVRGKVILSVDMKKECLFLSSPTSGIFEYLYDPETQQWLGSVDRHDIRGMITRDLIRHFRGMPNF